METFDFLEKAARLSSLAKTCEDPLVAQLLEELAETYTAEAQAAGQTNNNNGSKDQLTC